MYHHCNWWSRRYAYAYAASHASKSYYASRRHHRGGFGVRRPLRYLGYQLDLDDDQMRKVAAILDTLKVEREQGSLDEKKTISELANIVTEGEVSIDELREVLKPRIESAGRLQLAVARAVLEMVEVLDEDQREEFAYLLRNGTVVL